MTVSKVLKKSSSVIIKTLSIQGILDVKHFIYNKRTGDEE